MLLRVDTSQSGSDWTDGEITGGMVVGTATVERFRQRSAGEGLNPALVPAKPNRVYERKLDGDGEVYLIALARSESRAGWTWPRFN